MRLLEAEKADIHQSKIEETGRQRIRQLTKEENDAISDLNRIRAECEKEKTLVKKEADEFVLDQKKRKETAKKEADSIESFRKDLLSSVLKPVGEMQKEAEQRLAFASSEEKKLAKQFSSLEKEKESLNEKETEIFEREKSISAIEAKFDERKKSLDKREDEMRKFFARKEAAVKDEMAKARKILETSQQNNFNNKKN